MKTSEDAFVRGGGVSTSLSVNSAPPCAGLISSALPKVQNPSLGMNSDTGVSTKNVPNGIDVHRPSTLNPPLDDVRRRLPEQEPLQKEHWYAFRCTYGREKKAYEHFLSKGIKSFYPTITTKKCIDGKNMLLEESRLPNIFFAYGTFETLKKYVYDNIHVETKYIRFYYSLHHDGTKEPMIVPDRQINSLMLICDSNVDDILLEPFVVDKYLKGEHVLVKEGPFAGVEGVVARFSGQQRVGIAVEGLFTMLTAYVPTAFLEHINQKNNH